MRNTRITMPRTSSAGSHALRAAVCGVVVAFGLVASAAGVNSGPAGHRHTEHCQSGQCVPYCPARPSSFGYYGTQWRRWPGGQVSLVSGTAAATPVVPPRSRVPTADEESPSPLDAPEAPNAEDELPVPPAEPTPPARKESTNAQPSNGKPAVGEGPAVPAPEPVEPAQKKPAEVTAPPDAALMPTPARGWSRFVARDRLPEGYSPPPPDEAIMAERTTRLPPAQPVAAEFPVLVDDEAAQ